MLKVGAQTVFENHLRGAVAEQSKLGRMSTVTKNAYVSTLLSAISRDASRIRVVTRVNPSLLDRDGFFVCF
ncbi:hypothetical protein CON65_23520 [Bacillus pseudomycoides]|uniref:Uncharacterized protein n=1 Tax=Bacillus pseudomycoides TaxID=64104 RepID=A0AA91V835_9BACI|nr:hypothetical protein COO03_01830 [Bacillus sp. AFS098217]PED80310.1 hypothetical protein CON65_23520 [Bacillus pseudomycoides]PEU10152.1 hypothetical protein CN525_23825 [Bacillus sp. AFS014408]PFW61200.1 hypothetical protein COL20_18450 [Bacillus sp. AFS075034]